MTFDQYIGPAGDRHPALARSDTLAVLPSHPRRSLVWVDRGDREAVAQASRTT